MQNDSVHLTSTRLAHRFGVNVRTLHRWLANPKLGFPRPTIINQRRYWKEDDLVRWEETRVVSPKPKNEPEQ